ncbi:hypothetical protein C0J52_23350 [Blattella germanica]|nr:hypothetical protein C0J52_23350 [Blattella germanica]
MHVPLKCIYDFSLQKCTLVAFDDRFINQGHLQSRLDGRKWLIWKYLSFLHVSFLVRAHKTENDSFTLMRGPVMDPTAAFTDVESRALQTAFTSLMP